ncbi:MAG: GNAT family N-acetyltransferase [Chloroflexota bacterium]|nr:GNAT family N-acetyltransferase [Chloroflexota bacterium]
MVTERLRLREHDAGDLAALHGIASDPAVVEYLQFGPNEVSDTQVHLDQVMRDARAVPRRSYELVMTGRRTAELIGAVRLGMDREVDQSANLGYIVRRDLWGRGFATEAASAMVDYGFARLGLHRIWAICDVRNVGSRRVLEKLGMTREAHLREHLWVKGRWRDSYLYSILKQERER